MADRGGSGLVKSPQDLAGGLVLIALAALALWMSSGLAAGTMRNMGPGMVPRGIAGILAILGVILTVGAFITRGEQLSRWTLRGILFIVGAVVVFGLAIRPLGLAAAGPLVVTISGFASPETKWGETLAFGLVMTALCVGLFRFVLGLPIPVAPWAIGY